MFNVEQIVLVFEASFLQLQLCVFQRVDLAGRIRLTRSDLQLQSSVGQYDEWLSGPHRCTVLGQNLFHCAALIGGQVTCCERRGDAAHGDEVLEGALRHFAKGKSVDRHTVEMTMRAREQPNTRGEKQKAADRVRDVTPPSGTGD